MDAIDKILITGAGGMLGKYFVRELASRLNDCEKQIDTLGLSPYNNILCDLTRDIPRLSNYYDTVIHLVGSCEETEANSLNITATKNLLKGFVTQPKRFIYISSAEIYGREEGTNYTEATIPDPHTQVGKTKLQAEEILSIWAKNHNVTLTVLRAPMIVGTGMRGQLRNMVNSIYRGTYHHIADETAHVSVVHAVDVAYAACEISDTGGIFNITDCINPSLHDLAEAFAFRLKNKRIYTLSAKRARRTAIIGNLLPFLPFNKSSLASRYSSLTFSGEKLASLLPRPLNSVTGYLTTHNYDSNSL